MSFTEIKSTIKINAPKDKIWTALADLGGIQNFHPMIKESFYTSSNLNGVGATRHCNFGSNRSVEERVIDWKDGEEIHLEIYDFKKMPPFKFAHGINTLAEDEDGTSVTLTFRYQLKFGLIGSLMNTMMVKSQFEKMIPSVLKGLKKYLEQNKAA